MSYRIGLYGCGCRTQQILERALEDGVAKVTLCHDISEKNANALAEKYNAKVCSLDELLSSDEVDMYLISLFPAAHPDALLKAAKTGKPIYIEKPVAVFINDIQRLMPLTTRTDIHVGLSYRYIAVFRDLLDLVNSGKIGDLISVNCIQKCLTNSCIRNIGSLNKYRLICNRSSINYIDIFQCFNIFIIFLWNCCHGRKCNINFS